MDFENNWRRKQEIKMRPLIDKIYRDVFGNIEITRFDDYKMNVLDKEFAIDVRLTLPNKQILLGQEKSLSYQYSKFRTLTVEYYQNPSTQETGDWFKLASQIYFCGYCDEEVNSFYPWVLVDWFKLVLLTNQNKIKWFTRQNTKDNAMASFIYTKIDDLPIECLIASRL